MCGIVGHIGPHNSIDVVIEGLNRLEYRGYDSAGISFINDAHELVVLKKSGKLENLKGLLKDKKYISRTAIGHTRWATHGEVNDVNSHPHAHGPVAIVHNGIIENADTLRNRLAKKNFEFRTQTDSEVFLALLTEELEKQKNFLKAVTEAFKQLDGNSAFVILNRDTSEIVAIKKGAPLVCAINDIDSSVMVSSDPYALVGVANKLYFPEDNVLCTLSRLNKDLLRFYELDLTASKRYVSKQQALTLDAVDKGEFEHFMLKEIHEQPELVRSLTQFYFAGDGKSSLKNASQARPEKIVVSACGTAAYAGFVVRDYLEKFNRIPCSVELASEFRYRSPILGKKDLGIFISQSGETADTLAAQGLCKENNLKTLSIVNVEGSSLFRNCDHNLLIRAGMEIGVASTKAFTQMALTGRLLAHALAGDLENENTCVKISSKFSLLAERIDKLLCRVSEINNVAQAIHSKKGFFFTGRGIYFPIALEGALKLKEIAYVHAEGYASGELKHGPIALIDEEMVNIAIVAPELYEKTVSNVQEIKARKGVIVILGPEGDKDLMKMSDHYIALNFEGLDELAPLYVNVANQLLAYSMAKFKGTDIDKPRNLAKSVTVE